MHIEGFFHFQRLGDIEIQQGVSLNGYHAIAFASGQQFYGVVPHPAGQHPITGGGTAAALHMPQDGGTGHNAGGLLNALSQGGHIVAYALSHHDDEVLFAGGGNGLYTLHHIFVEIILHLGHQNVGGAYGDAGAEGQPAGVTAHNLHHAAPIMGL